MTEWTELRNLQDVAAAQARGDEIEYKFNPAVEEWYPWVDKLGWAKTWFLRSRPRKRTKTIVIREWLSLLHGCYTYFWTSESDASKSSSFIRWTGNERTEEVPE